MGVPPAQTARPSSITGVLKGTGGTKCYVTCGVNEVGDYLRRIERQTHLCYKIDPAHLLRV